jgi:hypothetical protein
MSLFMFLAIFDFAEPDLNQFLKCFYYFTFEKFQNIYFDFCLILESN